MVKTIVQVDISVETPLLKLYVLNIIANNRGYNGMAVNG
jgi:hypothetical protein